jgi:ketosteroid isomerase-like protein
MPVQHFARAVAVALLASLLIGPAAWAKSSTDDVTAANEALYKALSARDPDALGKLVSHNDYVVWGLPVSTDFAVGWAAIQKVFQGIPTHFQALQTTPSDVHVHVRGRTAWVANKEHVVGTRDNVAFDWSLTAVNVFGKIGTKWLLVLHHTGAPVK